MDQGEFEKSRAAQLKALNVMSDRTIKNIDLVELLSEHDPSELIGLLLKREPSEFVALSDFLSSAQG